MIRERIKQETKAHHDAVEAVSFSDKIMDQQLSLKDYVRLIKANYIINKRFEEQWADLQFEVPGSLQLERRRKTALLEKDLELLGVSKPEIPTVEFPNQSYPAFMGALYVFEGSTLGGSVIHKQLIKNPHLNQLEGFHFYKAYGDMTGPMWSGFLAELQKIEDDKEIEQSIEAARTTFDLVKSVFEKASRS